MLSLTTKPGCAGGFERQTAFAGEANEVIRPGTVVTAPELMRIHLTSDFIKGAAIAIVAAGVAFGNVDAQENAAPSPEASPGIRAEAAATPSATRTRDLIRAVLGDTEDVWDELFRAVAHGIYPRPTVVLVSRWALSECGGMDVTLAPFYCARDSRIYVDPTLLEKLANRSGDFAAAYVIAREVGRHVQVIVQAAQADTGGTPAIAQHSTAMPTAPEMQADCYAGVWTYSVRKRNHVAQREVEDGSAAAVTIGNLSNDGDYAARRLRAFRHGLSTGDPRTCDLSALPG